MAMHYGMVENRELSVNFSFSFFGGGGVGGGRKERCWWREWKMRTDRVPKLFFDHVHSCELSIVSIKNSSSEPRVQIAEAVFSVVVVAIGFF